MVKDLGFVKVAETSEVPVGKMKAFRIDGKGFLVANVNGNYYAIGNECFSLVVVVSFFVCALFFGVCCGFVFWFRLVFGFCLVVVVVVGG